MIPYKTGSSAFIGLGINRFVNITSAAALGATVFNGATDFAQGAYNQDPNKFERLGGSAGAAVGETAMLGMGLVSTWDLWRESHVVDGKRVGLTEGLRGANGKMYKALESGGAVGPNGERMGAAWEKRARQVNGRFLEKPGSAANPFRGSPGSKWIKPFNIKTNLLMFAGIPIAAGLLASTAGGLAGKFIDEQVASQRQSRQMSYDTRFFDSRRYDMNTYEQVGAAMESYQNKMVSVARIFHGR